MKRRDFIKSIIAGIAWVVTGGKIDADDVAYGTSSDLDELPDDIVPSKVPSPICIESWYRVRVKDSMSNANDESLSELDSILASGERECDMLTYNDNDDLGPWVHWVHVNGHWYNPEGQRVTTGIDQCLQNEFNE